MWDFDGVVNVQVVFEINTIQITKLIHYRVMHGQDYSLQGNARARVPVQSNSTECRQARVLLKLYQARVPNGTSV